MYMMPTLALSALLALRSDTPPPTIPRMEWISSVSEEPLVVTITTLGVMKGIRRNPESAPIVNASGKPTSAVHAVPVAGFPALPETETSATFSHKARSGTPGALLIRKPGGERHGPAEIDWEDSRETETAQ